MHLALSQVHQRTLAEQLRPAILCVFLVFVGIIIIPAHFPVIVSDGKIQPSVVRPGENAEVQWTQTWRELCVVTVTREFIGSDGFKVPGAPFDLKPPLEKGTFPYTGPIVVPTLPVGTARYRSNIQPHCWIDKFYQRSYWTPEVRITMLPPMPLAGPR